MDPSARVVSLDAQGNVVFTVVKPVMGIFQVSSDQAGGVAQGGMSLQGLAENALVLPQAPNSAPLDQSQMDMQHHVQPQVQAEEMTQHQELLPDPDVHSLHTVETSSQMPFAEVSSLLDPNMKGSKARKYLISYDEIKRRLQAPEKMSLRSLAAYTRVSRGPASKKTLLESLNVLGLTPSTTTSVSSSFSKLTEGDTRALCDDMRDFAHDYIDYGNMAKQLIPETNTVQHWSKIIETKNHLEDMRKCFKDPVNSGAFDSVTHGLGLGMLDVALDMIVMVIEQQIRILSGAAASDPADLGPPMRRIRKRNRKTRLMDNEKSHRMPGGVKEQGKAISRGKSRARARKKVTQEPGGGGGGSVPMETQSFSSSSLETAGRGGMGHPNVPPSHKYTLPLRDRHRSSRLQPYTPNENLNNALGAIRVLGVELIADELKPHLNTVMTDIKEKKKGAAEQVVISGVLPILALSLRSRGPLCLPTAKLVAELARETVVRKGFGDAGLVTALLSVLTTTDQELLLYAALAISRMSYDSPKQQELLLRRGAVPRLVVILLRFPDQEALEEVCLQALCNLSGMAVSEEAGMVWERGSSVRPGESVFHGVSPHTCGFASSVTLVRVCQWGPGQYAVNIEVFQRCSSSFWSLHGNKRTVRWFPFSSLGSCSNFYKGIKFSTRNVPRTKSLKTRMFHTFL